ncbi:MAG: glucuronyl hydrolase [Ruminococcaceae bacterium]|nr:glucuronyl hydrolase [Oscillospiraceae bacterium]
MVTEKITLNNPERFTKVPEISKNKLIKAAEKATDKLEALAKKYVDGFPAPCSVDYKYVCDINKNWVGGMYTGCYWRAYEITGNKFFREVAERHLETYQNRLDERRGMDDHDVGFVFTPSCIAAYKLTGNEYAKELALRAAEYYYRTSYSEEGKFIIRSWRSWASGSGCRTMMDSLMNAPLLFWASEQTANPKFMAAALNHEKTTERYLIREDGSSFHHYQFDPITAGPVRGLTFQGHKDDSCWSRGHAWGVYGFPAAYNHVKAEFLPKVHKAVSYFMLNHLPEDCVPYWDYDFVSGDEPRDSSAGVISACGMLEMAKNLPADAEEKTVYESAAAQMLEATIDRCTGDIGRDYDGLICHVTHAKPQGAGIDECAVYGDYFYLEALSRYLTPDFKNFW